MEEQVKTKSILVRLARELKENGGKISPSFITSEVERDDTVTQFFQLTDNMRVCTIRLESGHEVLGKSQVLDKRNDIKAVGEEIAFRNAINELWSVFGGLSLVIDEDFKDV